MNDKKSKKQSIRVSAVQFATGTDLTQNLATALRMIDQAANNNPDLIVLPEFCNHASWYDDKKHCWNVSLERDGSWLKAISDKAEQHQCYIVVNATLRRDSATCSGTSFLYGPNGALLGSSDKQVLMGHENDLLEKASEVSPVVKTEIGRIGMYACMDGVINETPRGLALSGAEILCNSLNSFAYDEASLHVPVRAAENKVFIVAANKVGSLIPEEQLEPVSSAIHIPSYFLAGAGESQIVAPDGTVLAKAPITGEAVIYADIIVDAATNKRRPDGTDIFASRRPELYGAISKAPKSQDHKPGTERLTSAIIQPNGDGDSAINDAANQLLAFHDKSIQLVTLPELFFISSEHKDVAKTLELSILAVESLKRSCAPGQLVATSILEKHGNDLFHFGVLIDQSGIVFRQAQLHRCNRHSEEIKLGDEINIYQNEFAAIAVIVGDDSIYPETFRLAAIAGAEVVALPCNVQETWEIETGLVERAAENRLNIIAASNPTIAGASIICALPYDFTILTPWEHRKFDGNINFPIIHKASRSPGILIQDVFPRAASNKMVSHNTDVLNGRPWALTQRITEANRPEMPM